MVPRPIFPSFRDARPNRVAFLPHHLIKNAEVERLVAEIAAMTGENKTEAVRRALLERRQRLTFQATSENKANRIRRFLENEVWPTVPREDLGRALSKEEEEAILGYGE